MARRSKVNKGAPSGFIISVVFHVAVFFVAGLFVVFKVMNPPEPEFEPPPPIERPKMKLKKPKVKVRKSSNPRPSSRIVAKVKTKQMPEIKLPDLVGTGEGLLGGSGAGGQFLDLPDIEQITVFGTEMSIGNDFVGVFYDPKRKRNGTGGSMRSRYYGGADFNVLLHKFLQRKMDPGVLSGYYRAPKKLYTTTFAMPQNLSLMAPTSFGCPDTLGCLWLVHYKGKLVYPEDIKFRFVACADDVITVMVDGEYVVQSLNTVSNPDGSMLRDIWYRNTEPVPIGRYFVVKGDWIELQAGVPKDMEVMMAEIPGGNFQAVLCVEVEGVDYPLNDWGGPILPIFRTAPTSRDLVDAIYSMSIPDDFSVTNGPIFTDYKAEEINYYSQNGNEDVDTAPQDTRTNRIWKTLGGNEIEGTLQSVMMDGVYVDTPDKKSIKLLTKDLCEADQKYIALEKSPQFRLKFITGRNQVPPPEQPPDTWYRPITITEYQFGVELTQSTGKEYPYPLTVEYFAIADETDGKNYRLLEKKSGEFIPSKENDRSFLMRGNTLRCQQQVIYPDKAERGYDYCGYLVVISDERGKVIQYDGSRKFLYKHLGALRKLQPGNHFNEECKRVTPARPGEDDRPDINWRGV